MFALKGCSFDIDAYTLLQMHSLIFRSSCTDKELCAAMVNVKPNLQIIADDVKCSHGCAVSDLEEEQLFYFR